jgi:Zn-dependent M28 family amino/carboxypeptidase
MSLRDLGFYVRGRINSGLTRVLNRRRSGGAPLRSVPLAQAVAGGDAPLPLTALLEGRSNAEREAAVGWYLDRVGAEVNRHRFARFEGRGENLGVEIGRGDRVVVLIAHHDAVPGSPGANDNAASVGILLHLLPRLFVPPSLRVRLLFTAAEELGYLGARAYVQAMPLDGIACVLSLELCGIGDSVALWDVETETEFVRRASGALDGLGLRRDESYHLVGRIPVFGSDHRAFAAAGIPAYGLSVVPFSEADALRRFALSPVRSALIHAVRRPPPFDTYHTPRDASATLDPRALDLVARSLTAIVAELGATR